MIVKDYCLFYHIFTEILRGIVIAKCVHGILAIHYRSINRGHPVVLLSFRALVNQSINQSNIVLAFWQGRVLMPECTQYATWIDQAYCLPILNYDTRLFNACFLHV